MLRFPYDEGLRQLLRAIPGRRWDPLQRAWCLPLEPEQAEALALLLRGLPSEPLISGELERAIARRRARRRRDECLVDLARPDEEWWLSFATDGAPGPVSALLEHPQARELPEIGRALVPLDDHAAGMLEDLGEGVGRLRLSEMVRRALSARAAPAGGERSAVVPPERPTYQVDFRRDRRGEHWILVAEPHARLARVLAAQAALRAAEGPAGAVGLAAVESDAEQLVELLEHLEDASVDPRVSAWLQRATTWRGNIEVQGTIDAPVFLLLGRHGAAAARDQGARLQRGGRRYGGAHARLMAADRGEARWLDEPRGKALRERAARGATSATRGARTQACTRSSASCSPPATTPR